MTCKANVQQSSKEETSRIRGRGRRGTQSAEEDAVLEKPNRGSGLLDWLKMAGTERSGGKVAGVYTTIVSLTIRPG